MSPHGWWLRRPKAMPEGEAEEKVAEVARVIRRIAVKQVEQRPIEQPTNALKAEVRQEIAPLVAQMPGFDWMTLYRAVLIQVAAQKAAERAIFEAQMRERDEEDALILLLVA